VLYSAVICTILNSAQKHTEFSNVLYRTAVTGQHMWDMWWGSSSGIGLFSCIFHLPFSVIILPLLLTNVHLCRLHLKCDGTRAETRFRLSAKRTSPFKSARASVQSTTGSRGVRISGSNAGYTKFRGSVKGACYPLNSPVCPSFPLPSVTLCHHVSTALYRRNYTV